VVCKGTIRSLLSQVHLSRTCHTKCISTRYAEPDLNKGESVCIDRCVAKFFEVNKKVGEKMQAIGAANQAAGGNIAAPGGSFGL
jgi:import inner membrane translocase subunit TIM10